jgi:hypothetical protein
VATPELLSVPGPSALDPSLNVTDLVGLVTVAVKVIESPTVAGLALAVRAVIVVA